MFAGENLIKRELKENNSEAINISRTECNNILLKKLKRLTELKLQYFQNPFFQDANPISKSIPAWSVPVGGREAFEINKNNGEGLIENYSFLKFNKGTNAIWYPFPEIPTGKFEIHVWAKGNGQISSRVMLGKKKSKDDIFYKRFQGAKKDLSPEWKEYVWELELPATINNGEEVVPDYASFQIFTQDNVWIGAAAFLPVSHKKLLESFETKADLPVNELSLPFLTIPLLKTPPKIDGNIEEAEWANAASLTGFLHLSDQMVSSRQPVVYIGYDASKLYLAYFSPPYGLIVSPAPKSKQLYDAIEFWFSPGEGKQNIWAQFHGMASGDYLEFYNKMSNSVKWEYKSAVKQVSDLMGGVETFSKQLWTAELAIPLKDLGLTGDALTQGWKMNLCRVYAPPAGQPRNTSDNTCWSPATSFSQTENFADVRLGKEKPVIRIKDYGNLKRGDWSISGDVLPVNNPVGINAKLSLKNGAELANKSQDVFPGASSQPYKIAQQILFSEPTVLKSYIEFKDKKTGGLLCRQGFLFKTETLLKIEAVPLFSQKILKVGIKTDDLGNKAEMYKVAVSLSKDANTVLQSKAMTWPGASRQLHILSFGMEALTPGEYKVNVDVLDNATQAKIASGTQSFVYPELPAWLNNNLGRSDEVLPPWQPVKVDGHRVSVVQRTYDLSDSGLPAQVIALDKELFAESPGIRLKINGKEEKWQFDNLKLQQAKDGVVSWQISGQAGPVKLTGKLEIEFDGYALWDVEFSAVTKTRIDELVLVFPFQKDRALIARGKNRLEDRGKYAAALFSKKPASSEFISNNHFSGGAWAWPNQWLNEIWVGDDDRGFSVMCESPRFNKGTRRTVLTPTDKAYELDVYLIDGPFELEGVIPYTYMWQATPVKPFPDNPKFRHGSRPSAADQAQPGFLERGHIAYVYAVYKHVGYTREFCRSWDDDYVKSGLLDKLRQANIKIQPYFSLNLLSMAPEEIKPFLPAWRQRPFRDCRFNYSIAALCCVGTSYDDYLCYALEEALKYGLGGLYLDVSGEMGYYNPYQEIGYYDPLKEEWAAVVPIRAYRELYKRLYHIRRAHNRDSWIHNHPMPVTALAGFVDSVMEGESWTEETARWQKLTPDYFRVVEAQNQMGPVYGWHNMWCYWQAEKRGGRAPYSEALAYCLPHNVLPNVSDPAIYPVWDLMDQYYFGEATFIPYWQSNNPIKIDKPENIIASTFFHNSKKQALLVIANWNFDWSDINAEFKVKELDPSAKNLQITRAIQHPILGDRVEEGRDPMGNTPILLNNNSFKLRIAPRNLEIIQAKWE